MEYGVVASKNCMMTKTILDDFSSTMPVISV